MAAWKKRDDKIALILILYVIDPLRPFAVLWGALDSLAASGKIHKDSHQLSQTPGFNVAFALCGASLFWLITYGTGDLAQGELYGYFFDELGQNLSHGRIDIDPEILGEEAFTNNGKTYTYFGVFPMLIRWLPNAILPKLYGQWSRLSCYVAGLLIVWAACLITNVNLRANKNLLPPAKNLLIVSMPILLTFGTPFFFLMSCGYIYHEISLWALAWCLWGMYFVFSLNPREPARETSLYLGLSTCAAGAFLSKPTYAVPLFLILGLCFVWNYGDLHNPNSLKRWLLVSLPILLTLAFQAWYNWARFGSIFELCPLFRHYWYVDLPAFLIPELFDFNRIPEALTKYFWVGTSNFSKAFPHILPGPGFGDEIAYDYIEWIAPLSLTSSWLIAIASIGLVIFFTQEISPFYRSCAYAFLLQFLLILSFYWMTNRYASELLPFLLFMSALAMRGFPKLPRNPFALKAIFSGLLVLIGLSFYSTIATTMYISATSNWGVSEDFRRILIHQFSRIQNIHETPQQLRN